MQERSYGWSRRWSPTDIQPHDPLRNPGAPLADWSSSPCLVLLGEGGLGKSYELRAERERLTAAGSTAYLCDLGRTTDRTAVRELLPQIQPGESATLFIDGFDEVFDDVVDIAQVLDDYLTGIDRSSVSVRIASRPVVWSTALEARLKELWPRAVGILTLEPITAEDVRSAAAAEFSATDASRFTQLVQERDLWSLATSPITLSFLFDAFREAGTLERDRLTIHREGIAHLASEQHNRRLDRRRPGPPSAERMATARHLAYLSMFGGHSSIDTRRSPRGTSVDLDDVAGADGLPPARLDAVAQSGLFRPGEGTTVKWAHRSIPEFLAADHIRSWPLATLLNLLTQPTQPTAIAPQLVGVATWVAVTHTGLFAWLVDHDPAILLDSNLADLPSEHRVMLVERLVDRILAGEAFEWREIRRAGLSITPVADALRQHLADPTVTADTKTELVHLVRNSGERGLDEVLASLVSDAADAQEYDETLSLGRWAWIALDESRDDSILSTLVDVARAPKTNRWIREDLLSRFHPEVISTSELLTLLPSDALAGEDTTFRGLVRRMQDAARHDTEALVALLRWLSAQDDAAHHDHLFVEAVADALTTAVKHLDQPEVLDAAGLVIGIHAKVAHRVAFREQLADLPADQRHRLLEAAATATDSRWLVGRLIAGRLVGSDDYSYYVERLAGLHSNNPADLIPDHWIVAAAHASFHQYSPQEQALAAQDAKRLHPQIAEFVEYQWGTAVTEARRQSLAGIEAAQAQQRAALDDQLFNQARLSTALADGSWPRIASELRRPVRNRDMDGWLSSDQSLVSADAWQPLEHDQQESVIQVAESFIRTVTVDEAAASWIAEAVALLADIQPDLLDTVGGQRWLELVGPLVRAAGGRDVCALVVGRAAAADQAAVDRIVLDTLEQDAASGHALTLDRLGDYEPVGLNEHLLHLALHEATDQYACRSLLGAAFERRAPGAADAALEIVARRPSPPATTSEAPPPEDSAEAAQILQWRRAAVAGAALATAPVGMVDSEAVLTMLTTEWGFTSAVVTQLGVHPGDQFLAGLASDEIATLYLWADQYVDVPTYEPGRAYSPNPVHELPNTLLQTIGARQDAAAVAALDDIAAASNSRAIRSYASRVRRTAHASTWLPIPLADLRTIAANTDRRVIRTPQELTVAVREALDNLGHELRTNAARRHRYWHHQTTDNCYVPVKEEAASDELALELQDRLGRTVVSREVQIEPRIGNQAASEVDLLVSASGDGLSVSCIIEVKANWYPNLVKRVQTQLTDRYLQGPQGNAGVFVVLWFAGQHWCNQDLQRRKPLKDRRRLERTLRDAVTEVADGYVDALVLDCTLEQHT